MWLYIIGGVVLAAVVFVLYLMYKGYSKVKPKPLPGITCPPYTHAIFGHPDKMMSPLKHILRLEVSETVNTPYHQLVMFQHSSVFINDAEEAGHLFNTIKTKGIIYDIFRYMKNTPDMIASDNEQWTMRANALRSSLLKVRFNDNLTENKDILSNLLAKLNSFAESGEPMDVLEIMTYTSMDIISQNIFNYSLNALKNSNEGVGLNKCLTVLSEHMAGQGIYANPKVKKYTTQEITAVTTDWRNFITKLSKHAKTKSEEYKTQHGKELDVTNNFNHALIDLSEKNASKITKTPFSENELFAEIHQVFRHSHECIAGTLTWAMYALFRYPKIRAKLEIGLSKNPDNFEYLECFLKEVLRKYPVTGNLTVRTVSESPMKLSKGQTLPVGTPVHFHMWTLQNSSREWHCPHEFIPERWSAAASDSASASTTDTAAETTMTVEEENRRRLQPKCPFLFKNSSAPTAEATATAAVAEASRDFDLLFEGSGFTEESLSYFPFSAGPRSCPAKGFVLQVLKKVVTTIVLNYRFEPFESTTAMENDPGASNNAVVIPLFKQSSQVRVDRASELGKIPAKKDDGWAVDEEDDDATPRRTL